MEKAVEPQTDMVVPKTASQDQLNCLLGSEWANAAHYQAGLANMHNAGVGANAASIPSHYPAYLQSLQQYLPPVTVLSRAERLAKIGVYEVYE